MRKQALILANGHPPRKSLLQELLRASSLFVCVDGGANIAASLKLKPDAIVGDLDSIHAETRVRFQHVPMHQIIDDTSTDLEKAIAWTIKQKYEHIVVVGATGKRLDHTVGNLAVLAKFFPDAVITMVDDMGELVFVGRTYSFEAPPGTVVSLIPLARCDGITTRGLKFTLEGETLELGGRGISNVVVSNPVSITVERGNLLLYRRTTPHH